MRRLRRMLHAPSTVSQRHISKIALGVCCASNPIRSIAGCHRRRREIPSPRRSPSDIVERVTEGYLISAANTVGESPKVESVSDELDAVVRGITAGLSLDDALAGVLRAVEHLVGATSASIFLAEPD